MAGAATGVQRLRVNGTHRDLGLAETRAAAFANRQLARRGGESTAAQRPSKAPTVRALCERVESVTTRNGVGAENLRRALGAAPPP